jgi:monoterpene epsilon-lactone hydrolase
MNFTNLVVLACATFAGASGAAQTNGGALAPLQVPAKSLPVPTDVSPEMQKIIAAPRNPAWNVLWKTGEEWRAAANEQAAQDRPGHPGDARTPARHNAPRDDGRVRAIL